jgi:hypothetical protein
MSTRRPGAAPAGTEPSMQAPPPGRPARRDTGSGACVSGHCPLPAQLLGDLGAEIVKVEHGELDSSRVMGGGLTRSCPGSR